MNKITLYDVIDIRTMQYHSVVVCKERMAKWFIPANEAEDEVE